jgi:hypothetical protein
MHDYNDTGGDFMVGWASLHVKTTCMILIGTGRYIAPQPDGVFSGGRDLRLTCAAGILSFSAFTFISTNKQHNPSFSAHLSPTLLQTNNNNVLPKRNSPFSDPFPAAQTSSILPHPHPPRPPISITPEPSAHSPSDTLTPTENDLPKRSKSAIALTASTLFGIYSLSDENNKDAEPSTPSLLSRNPSILSMADFDLKDRPPKPDNISARTRPKLPKRATPLPLLILRVVSLFAFVVAYGVIVNYAYSQFETVLARDGGHSSI